MRGPPERRSGCHTGRIGKPSRINVGVPHGPRPVDRTCGPGRPTSTTSGSGFGASSAATRDIRAMLRRSCVPASMRAGTGRTFTASPGHFDMFWTRDLSFSVPSLIRLGHGERVHRSLAHALDVWARRRSHITTTIHYFDRPGDVFEYGVDSLPLFLAALRAADADRPRGAPPRRGSRPRSPTSTTRVVDPRTGLVRCGPEVQRPPRHGRQSIATRTATRWSRCWPRRSRRPAGSRRRSSATSRATTAACSSSTSGSATTSATRSATTRSRARPTSGRSTPASSPTRAVSAAALGYLDANGFCDPYPLRYETSRRPEREVWLTRPHPARLSGQHRVDQPRGDVPAGAAHGRSFLGRVARPPAMCRGSSATGHSGRS